jgi:outer membrane protein
MRITVPTVVAASLLAMFGTAAFAQSGCRAPSPDCVAVGELDISMSIGYGERSNPIIGNSDIPLVLLPQISYYGERFFLENLELGFTLHEGAAHTLNVIATPGYDRVFFFRDDLQNIFVSGATLAVNVPPSEMPAVVDEGGGIGREFVITGRHTTYLAGPEWLFRFGDVIGQIDALREVTGEHGGYEVRAAIAAPIVQSANSVVVSAGLTWKSAELVRYYYGVDGLYEPRAALNPFVKLGFARPLSERWTLSAHIHHERLDSEIADSPILAEDTVTTFFAGLVFKLL